MKSAHFMLPLAIALTLSTAFAQEKGAANAHAHHEMKHQETMPKSATLSASQEMTNLMHEPMMEVPFLESDNLDLNFITNMIPHHQGAVDSAEFVLKHSKNKQIRAIATEIIKTQKSEIEQFNAMLEELENQKQLYSPKEVTLFNNQAKADMEAMHKAMNEVPLTNKIDRDFLQVMIPHHQGAVEASKQILIYSQNKLVREIAQTIIDTQEKEIEQFNKLLTKLP